jgi:hypothetical protein
MQRLLINLAISSAAGEAINHIIQQKSNSTSVQSSAFALDFHLGHKSKEKYSRESIRRESIIEAKETSDREMPFLPFLAIRETKPGQ